MASVWFKNLPEEEKRDYVLYYVEALASAYRTMEISYNYLRTFYERVLEKLEETVATYSSALANAWMFVDSYALFAKLLYKCPFKTVDERTIESFNLLSKPIRDCRDCHYHLDGENRYREGKESQVMGNLSWVNENGKCVIVMPRYHLRRAPIYGVIYDTVSAVFTARLCLMFNNKQIDFDYYHEHIQKIKDALVAFFHDESVSSVFNILTYSSFTVGYVRGTETDNKHF